MRIEDKLGLSLQKLENRKAGSAKADEKSADGSVAKADGLELSSSAKEAIELTKNLREAADVQRERVVALKEQIAKGEYKIDSESVARRIIDMASGNIR